MAGVGAQGRAVGERQVAQALADGVIIARGPRVSLRTFTPGDIELLAQWADEPFLERMVGSELLRSFKHVYDKDPSFYEAALNDPSQIVFVIVATAPTDPRWKKPLGLIRLFNIHLIEGYAFLECMLADVQATRHGFGVEASKLICSYGVDVLGLRRIEAKVYEFNRLSINSLRRHGFQQEGVLRQAGFHDGQPCDVLVFGLLRDELEEQRRREPHPECFHFPFEGTAAGLGDAP